MFEEDCRGVDFTGVAYTKTHLVVYITGIEKDGFVLKVVGVEMTSPYGVTSNIMFNNS